MLIFQITLLVVVLGGVAVIFYFRIGIQQESKKISQQMQKLCDQKGWDLSLDRKYKGDIFPLIKGILGRRDLLIERRLEDKFKFWVISLGMENPQNLHWHVLHRDHLTEKQDIGELDPIDLPPKFARQYLVFSNQKAIAIDLLEKTMPFWQKHQQISFLFSTVVAFQNRITLVLLSSNKKLKNDLILDKCALWLDEVASLVEQE